MRRFLNSDVGAWVTPCALVAGLLVAVYGLGGCSDIPKPGKSVKEFWDERDRASPSRSARRP